MLPPRIYLFVILISVVILSTTSSALTSSAVVETRNKNNWDFVNHDIYGTRNSNQTIIGKDNVDNLEVKWRLFNDFEIQDPPIVIGNRGYVQDYADKHFSF